MAHGLPTSPGLCSLHLVSCTPHPGPPPLTSTEDQHIESAMLLDDLPGDLVHLIRRWMQ